MSDNITITETTILIPNPTETSTIILVGGGGYQPYFFDWTWPIILGVIAIITCVFTIRFGWNIKHGKD